MLYQEAAGQKQKLLHVHITFFPPLQTTLTVGLTLFGPEAYESSLSVSIVLIGSRTGRPFFILTTLAANLQEEEGDSHL